MRIRPAFQTLIAAATVAFTTLAGTSLAIAQQAKPSGPAARPKAAAAAVPASNDALTIYSGGMEKLLVDPKDAGLLKALRMLDQRILELPAEIGQPQVPAPAIQLVWELLTNPMTFRAGMLTQAEMDAAVHKPDRDGGAGGPPFYAQFNFLTKDQSAAENLAGRITGALASTGAPNGDNVPNMPGMQMVDADGAPLYHGTLKSGQPGAIIALSKLDPAPLDLASAGLPKGVSPAMTFTLDCRKLKSLMEMISQQTGGGDDFLKQMQTMGLYGPNAANISVAAGHGTDRSHSVMRYANYRQVMEQTGASTDGPIVEADLHRIPGDATYAQVSKYNFGAIVNVLQQMSDAAAKTGGGAPDILAMIEQQTGINVQHDITDNLGQTVGFYMSDSTGGGGLLSSVMFVQVKNAEGLNATRARLRGMINQLGQQHAKGYVRMSQRNVAGLEMQILTFPGLPVPLEISFTESDGWMFAAASPQALVAAVAQAKSGKSSLADNARFKEMGGGDLNGAIQVQFVDTPRMIRDGYGIVSMGLAALSNAVRSPVDANRDAGMIMPMMSDLMKDAKATVTVSRIAGDDLVMTSQGDRSLLVNACGAIGMIGGSTGAIAAAALAIGITMPALGQAREAAQDVKSMAQLRQLGMAMIMYANDNNDSLPKSTQILIDKEFITADLLDSPVGDADAGVDFWIDMSGVKLSAIENPSIRILGYDRAMFVLGGDVNVLYADGHVEKLSRGALNEAMLDPANAGIVFGLQE